MQKTIPKYIFIVPYRDRLKERIFFTNYMKIIMEDYSKSEYEIYFSHQYDDRPFNRGAVKNIGFLAMKNKYPKHYKDIIFIFNDVDTVPYDKNILKYNTEKGVIKHFYGFTFCLGGIFSIYGSDFEKTNGFPNWWGWGQEDNCMQVRALRNNISIDRSNFFKIGDENILQLWGGVNRIIIKDKTELSKNDNGSDGIREVTNLEYIINENDILIKNFDVPRISNNETYLLHNIENSNSNKTNVKLTNNLNNNNLMKSIMSIKK